MGDNPSYCHAWRPSAAPTLRVSSLPAARGHARTHPLGKFFTHLTHRGVLARQREEQQGCAKPGFAPCPKPKSRAAESLSSSSVIFVCMSALVTQWWHIRTFNHVWDGAGSDHRSLMWGLCSLQHQRATRTEHHWLLLICIQKFSYLIGIKTGLLKHNNLETSCSDGWTDEEGEQHDFWFSASGQWMQTFLKNVFLKKNQSWNLGNS